MLFSSITFIYFFLPLMLFLYFITSFIPFKGASLNGRNSVLFLMSVIFYAWGEPVYVFLMLAQILAAYILTALMERYKKRKIGRVFYILSVFFPFAALFYFKYFEFFFKNIFGTIAGVDLPSSFKILLPIGISFYTFQITSYCIDVYKGRVKRQKNFITFAAYVTLFPQLVAGPIVRYSDIEGTLVNGINSSDMRTGFEQGIVRFITGLGKKVLIANVLGEFVTEVSGMNSRGIVLSWAYAAAVALQLYFDFSGYSDMAIGLGNMLGFSFPENFRYPFISKSVSEFWRRWHITLGAWFRDYVYIPMGGNRVSLPRWILNILIVWLFTGLWHGAGWNFIIWGLSFALFLVIEKFFMKKAMDSAAGKVIGHIYVVIVIIVTFLIFHNTDMKSAWTDISSLWRGIPSDSKDLNVGMLDAYMIKNRIGILTVAILGATPAPFMVWQYFQKYMGKYKCGEVIMYIMRSVFVVALLVLCTAYLIDGSFNPFLYFRF